MVTLLQGSGLSFAYPEGPAVVTGLSLSVSRGEFLCLLGQNGAGKSTCMKLLAGLLVPQSGRVLDASGEALLSLSARERAQRLAVVPQQLSALPQTTVTHFVQGGRYAHLGFFKTVKESDLRAVREALAVTDAGHLQDRLLTELSGGERQRVLIARALAQESDVVLCDEPTASLDPQHQVEVMELLAKSTCSGRGILVVTHDLNLASQFATRIVLLKAGRIVADGRPSEVLQPEILLPVYGDRLYCTRFPDQGGEGPPLIVPWRG